MFEIKWCAWLTLSHLQLTFWKNLCYCDGVWDRRLTTIHMTATVWL